VQIAYLCGVLQDLGEKARYPGIARLLARLERQRERIQPEVVKAVDRLQASGVLEEMLALTKRVLSEAESQGAGLHGPLVFGQLQRHVLENLDRLLSYQDSLADPEDRDRHHAMRIAAKRLRYSLEISAPAYPGQLEVAVEVTRRVQTLLGEVHDCDVWVEELRAFAAKLCKRIRKHFADTGPFARLHVGIEYLQQERRRRRQQAFQELVDYWQELHRRREWQRLADVLKGDRVRPLSDPLPGSQCAAMP
jgi:CHAD domain-containing protein